MRSSTFLAVTVALLLLVDSAAGRAKKKKKREANATVSEKTRECASVQCHHLVPLENTNCVNECVSPACYRKTFTEPLEDGEINDILSNSFKRCAQQEMRIRKQPSRKKAKTSGKPVDYSTVVESDGNSRSAIGLSPGVSGGDVGSEAENERDTEESGDSGDYDDDVEEDGEEESLLVGDVNVNVMR